VRLGGSSATSPFIPQYQTLQGTLRRAASGLLGDGAWEKSSNLKRLVDEISARPAAQKAVALKDRHKFKTEMDAEALQAMFPHLKVKVA
jgi:GST-like protein